MIAPYEFKTLLLGSNNLRCNNSPASDFKSELVHIHLMDYPIRINTSELYLSSMSFERLITKLDDKERYWRSIEGKTIAVIGYGNQGRSQALNMRDNGVNVIIGNPPDEYRKTAEKEGFRVYEIDEAVKNSEIVFMLIPDEVQPEVFSHKIADNLKQGSAIVFASGYNYFYDLITVPSYVDVLLVAPRMIGFGIRDLFLKGKGFPVLIAVGKDYTGQAEEKLLALTDAIGALKPGGVAVRSSFKEETLLDLLTEHTWAGAILYMFRLYYEVATELGASPEAIILELYGSGELAEIAESMKQQGLFKQLKNHSHTSQYGQLSRGRLFANEKVKQLIKKMALEILDGTFAKEWTLEQKSGLIHYKNLYKMNLEHPMEREEEKLYRLLGRIK